MYCILVMVLVTLLSEMLEFLIRYKTLNISVVAELHDTKECSVSKVLDCLNRKIK